MSSQQVSRRTVARGVAWTVPVVAVSVAAPAFAVSGPAPTAVITSICTCGSNGRMYRISVTFTNTIATSFDLSNLSVASGNNSSLAVLPATFTVPAGPGTTAQTFRFTRTNSSTYSPVTFTYTATNTSNNVTTAPQTTAPFTGATTTCAGPTC